MDHVKLLIDIGSTFTKIIAVDLHNKTIAAKAKSPTTISDDITRGVMSALGAIKAKIGGWKDKEILACSSAAGGLRMISIGLVPQLSSEAARRAALGAGAKIVGHYSYQLRSSEIKEMEQVSPDIILLAGGTDGGNERAIIHNAGMLSRSSLSAPIVVAGNRDAYDDIENILRNASKRYRLVGNAMPEIGRLEVEACREVIRELFMENIVRAKGLDRARHLVGDIIMPTPAAVLNAAVLVSQGTKEEEGLGELIAIDVGGATTDVYSISSGSTTRGEAVLKGLPEPFAKRTVEGDLGVRHNIDTLLKICETKEVSLDGGAIAGFRADPNRTPRTEMEMVVDGELARVAVEISFERHVGRLNSVYGPHGEILIQTGKDLGRVTTVIGTGGPLVYSSDPARILETILDRSGNGSLLKPTKAQFYVDHHYLMYAVGLLAKSSPAAALRIMKKYLKAV